MFLIKMRTYRFFFVSVSLYFPDGASDRGGAGVAWRRKKNVTFPVPKGPYLYQKVSSVTDLKEITKTGNDKKKNNLEREKKHVPISTGSPEHDRRLCNSL